MLAKTRDKLSQIECARRRIAPFHAQEFKNYLVFHLNSGTLVQNISEGHREDLTDPHFTASASPLRACTQIYYVHRQASMLRRHLHKSMINNGLFYVTLQIHWWMQRQTERTRE